MACFKLLNLDVAYLYSNNFVLSLGKLYFNLFLVLLLLIAEKNKTRCVSVYVLYLTFSSHEKSFYGLFLNLHGLHHLYLIESNQIVYLS